MKTLITRLWAPLAAAVLVMAAPGAQAQTAAPAPWTAEEVADLQCMAIYAIVANQSDQASAGAVGIFYFWGRLEARNPSVDWLQTLATYADSVTQAELEPQFDRCRAALVTKSERMAALGSAEAAPAAGAPGGD